MTEEQASGFSDASPQSSDTDKQLSRDGALNPECPVCLQTCIHPVQLPCNHIFCFLCIKGVANRSKRCALCRNEIPVEYLNNPVLINLEDLKKDIVTDHGGYQWFYEGRNGWWQYDERTSVELEEKHAKGEKVFELLIAGFLYVIDLDNMIQVRRNDPYRRRRIKRDRSNIEKKGIAGLKIIPPEEREGAYGEEGGKSPTNTTSGAQTQQNTGQSQPRPKAPPKSPGTPRLAQAPGNTPQSPSTSLMTEASTPELDRDLSLQMDSLSLDTSGVLSLDSTRSTDLERSSDLDGSYSSIPESHDTTQDSD